MTYITDSMRTALAEHKLRQVCNAGGVRVFRMQSPRTIVGFVDLVFLPDRIGITGDCTHGSWSRPHLTFAWFIGERQEHEVDEAFFPDLVDDSVIGNHCAIQQRFAELYREREARIEAIVAAWVWRQANDAALPYAYLKSTEGYNVAGQAGGAWRLWNENGDPGGDGTAADAQSAKRAARAAVLKQAKEHPELWHCGVVDE